MFYCDNCRKEAKTWCDSMIKSRGRCEICGEVGVCNDMPSSCLPVPNWSEEFLRKQGIKQKKTKASA